MNELFEFSRRIRELDDSLAVNIQVDWRVALQIVVDDLTKKYKHNVGRNEEWAEAFKKVLSYYLDEQEMAHLTTNAQESAKRQPKCVSCEGTGYWPMSKCGVCNGSGLAKD